MPKRPIVLLSAIVFIKIYFILKFPSLFLYVLLFDAVFSALLLLFSAGTKRFFAIAVLCILSLASTLITGYTYRTDELKAKNYCKSLIESNITEYTAKVYEFHSYGTYAVAFVTLDGTNIKARLGTYSGANLVSDDEIVFEGKPVFVTEVENDSFNTRDYLRSKRVFIEFPSAAIISSFDGGKTSFLHKLRNYTKSIIYSYIPRGQNYDTAAFCYAVFAGDKNLLPEDMKRSFSRCGLTHILCVSGMHLAILAGVLYSILSTFSLHKRTRCISVILLCIFYTAFTGFSLSTVRACIMCSVSYFGIMTGRKTDVYRSLFLSLLAICLVSPYSVLDISLQLSFCATLGIACFAEFIPDTKDISAIKKAGILLLSVLLSNMGAVVFTLPVNASYFGGFSVMSAISTLAVSFIFEIVLTGVLLLILISPLSFFAFPVPAIRFIGVICHTLSLTVINSADFFSDFRYASVTSRFSLIYGLIFIALLCILALFISLGKRQICNICTAVILVLGIVFSVISLIFFVSDDRFYRITYYRKNENNRQLSVKLGTQGYLIINADSSLCTDRDAFLFDEYDGNNYILIVPDKALDPSSLSNDLIIFHNRFGISGVFVPESYEGKTVAEKLLPYGINCQILPEEFSVGNINMTHSYNSGFVFTADDGKVSTAVLFGDEYRKDILCGYDITAFFTRKTKNQFDTSKDSLPDGKIFFTRLKKDEQAEGIINTNGEKYITIKG